MRERTFPRSPQHLVGSRRFRASSLAGSLGTGVFALALGWCTAGCSTSSPASTDVGQAVTNQPESSIKNQSDTGNCWLYATTAWAESLSADSSGKTKSYSTTYLVYWNFYDQILESASESSGREDVEWTGGTWGGAAELIRRFGLTELKAFTGSTSQDADADLAIKAQKTVNESLARGALKTKAARSDPKAVLKELNRAFGVTPALVSAMNATFGEDGKTTFDAGAQASGAILSPEAVAARLPAPSGTTASSVTLADAIGTPAGDGSDPDQRKGSHAWRGATLNAVSGDAKRTKAMRTFMKRIQRALHDGVPVPISWCVEVPDDVYKFEKAISGVQDGYCAHETLVTDYQVKLASGKVLPAGKDASAADKAAALADDAEVVFIRVKNSWGNTGLDEKPGYTDVYMPYLMSSVKSCPNEDTSAEDCEDWSFMIYEASLPPGY